MEFPDLRMIVAHLGHPWEEDLVALVRKAPNVWADVSACHYRPWRYWQAMATAFEYGVTHKLLLGSDFPSGTVDNVIDGLRRVNEPVEGTRLPHIPDRGHRVDHLGELEGGVPGVGLTIDSVEAIPVRAERTKPMISAGGGAPLRVSDFGIVRIRTSDGIEGVGEISMNGGRDGRDPVRRREPDHRAGARRAGPDPAPRDHRRSWTALLDGSEPAKAGVEMALVDITGKVRGLPAYAVLGGAVRERVPIRWGSPSGRPTTGVARGVRLGRARRPDHQDQDRPPRDGPRRGDGAGRPRGAGRRRRTSWSTRTPATGRRRRPSRSSVASSRTGSSSSSSR